MFDCSLDRLQKKIKFYYFISTLNQTRYCLGINEKATYMLNFGKVNIAL